MKAYQITNDLSNLEKGKSYSTKLLQKISENHGINYVKRWPRELVKESSRIERKLCPFLSKLPSQGVAFLLSGLI